jgi:hypothetical protein
MLQSKRRKYIFHSVKIFNAAEDIRDQALVKSDNGTFLKHTGMAWCFFAVYTELHKNYTLSTI